VAKIIAYACLAISATLAGLYGYITADTVLYGVIRAASLCAVAIVGPCCPAWASHHWNDGRYGQCLLTWLVCAVCLAVTLGGGIGTIAGGAEHSMAERAKASDQAAFARTELARVTAELGKLPDHRPAGTVKSDLEAFRAGRPYKASNGCDPEQITGKAAREACDGFRKLEGELETAKAARELEGKATALNATLAKQPAVQNANPQAAAISTLLRIPVEEAVNWYAFVASLALELAGMAAMLRAESRPVPRHAWEDSARASEPRSPREICEKSEERGAAISPGKRPTVIAGITLLDPPKALAGADTVGRFMLACLKRVAGEEAPGGAIYGRYQRWCGEQRPALLPLDLQSFAQQFAMRCDRAGIQTRRDGRKVYCLDVKLLA
jgi:hypothetical protein